MTSVFSGLPGVFVNVLGQAVTVTPVGGVAREITAIVVNRAVDEYGVVQPQPAIHAVSTDTADLADGAAVTVNGVNYLARGFKPDGRGVVTITLEATS